MSHVSHFISLLCERTNRSSSYKRVEKHSRYSLYTGKNEDEIAPACIYLVADVDGREYTLWAEIDYPESISTSDPEGTGMTKKEANAIASKAVSAWRRAAKIKVGYVADKGRKSWFSRWKEALLHGDVRGHIKAWGFSRTNLVK